MSLRMVMLVAVTVIKWVILLGLRSHAGISGLFWCSSFAVMV